MTTLFAALVAVGPYSLLIALDLLLLQAISRRRQNGKI